MRRISVPKKQGFLVNPQIKYIKNILKCACNWFTLHRGWRLAHSPLCLHLLITFFLAFVLQYYQRVHCKGWAFLREAVETPPEVLQTEEGKNKIGFDSNPALLSPPSSGFPVVLQGRSTPESTHILPFWKNWRYFVDIIQGLSRNLYLILLCPLESGFFSIGICLAVSKKKHPLSSIYRSISHKIKYNKIKSSCDWEMSHGRGIHFTFHTQTHLFPEDPDHCHVLA